MEASLTCAVCLSLFEEPVTLPLCSHNFCRGCVLECLASAQHQQRGQGPGQGQGQARLSRGGPGPGGGGGGRVPCPLCRKLSPLPRGGAAALPVNTTLAEVVKLYRSGAAGEPEQGQGPGQGPLVLRGTCQKHPGRLVQLYCRMCRRAGCGQCVSEEHQGIFHSVNLIDTVFQEEKPVAGQEEALTDGGRICTRLMSISEMSAFQNMSHEELRYKYYMERQKLADEFKTQTLPANKKHKFVAAEASKDKSSGIPSVSLPTTANNTYRVNMGILQKEGGFNELNFFGTSNHRIPSTTTNFSEKNGNLSLVHERGSEETTTPALSENSKDLLIREKMPMQSSAVTVSNGMDANSSILGGLKPAASVATTVSNSEFLDVSAERPSTSPFAFGACSNSLPRFIKNAATFSFKKEDSKYIFPKFYLGKCDREAKTDNQDESKFGKHSSVTKTAVSDASNTCNVESAENEKMFFSFPFSNSERNCSAVSGVSNSSKILSLSSFFNQPEKPADQNTLSHMVENAFPPKKTVENDVLKPSVSVEQKANASESITTAPCSTSETGIAAGVDDVSESPLLPSTCVFSFKNNCFQLPSPVFSFGSIVKNTTDSLTSSSVFLSSNGTEKSEQEKMKSLDKTPLNLVKSASPERAETASRHSHPKDEGSFPVDSSKKIESAEILADSNSSCSPPLCSAVLAVKDENASSTHLAMTSTQQEVKVKHQESIAENNCSIPGREDELESRMLQNAACSAPGTCNDSVSRASVLTVNESGGMLSDSDSDTEELSQTSVSSDTSSVSEYFSVAEDKIPTRRKSEA